MEGSEIGRGAEAVVLRTRYLGRDAVVKVRPAKGYRHPDLDRRLRAARTRSEVRVMREARAAGVRTPVVYDVDLEESSITMEYLAGEKVKDVLDRDPGRADEVCRMVGEAVAMLHRAGVCHGDLTTSNMILSGNGSLGLIDFSMGGTRADVEELGVDIHLLERAFSSAHSGIGPAFACILDAYRGLMPGADEVLRRVEAIKGRARYT